MGSCQRLTIESSNGRPSSPLLTSLGTRVNSFASQSPPRVPLAPPVDLCTANCVSFSAYALPLSRVLIPLVLTTRAVLTALTLVLTTSTDHQCLLSVLIIFSYQVCFLAVFVSMLLVLKLNQFI